LVHVLITCFALKMFLGSNSRSHENISINVLFGFVALLITVAHDYNIR